MSFFSAGFFVFSISFVLPFLKGRVQAAHDHYFFNGFSSFLLPIVFLVYNCGTIVHATHSSDVPRNEAYHAKKL